MSPSQLYQAAKNARLHGQNKLAADFLRLAAIALGIQVDDGPAFWVRNQERVEQALPHRGAQ